MNDNEVEVVFEEIVDRIPNNELTGKFYIPFNFDRIVTIGELINSLNIDQLIKLNNRIEKEISYLRAWK